MATPDIFSQEIFHIENNAILTTTDRVSVQNTFNYLSDHLDQFKVGSEFVIVCGVHGSPEGQLKQGDEDFRYDYEMMFRWFRNHKKYGHEAKIVEERKYNMGKILEISSIEEETEKGKYLLTDDSKTKLQNEFERILASETPVVLVLASCWSFRSMISNILRSTGLYSALIASEDRGNITAGKLFKLNNEQQDLLKEITNDDSKKDIIIFGEYSNFQTNISFKG